MKIFLEKAFISNEPSELAGFPSLFDQIKCCVVKETVHVPVWIAQPVNRSGISMEDLRIQQLARSTILVPLFRTLHCISVSVARIVSSTADLAILLNHLILCDRQIYAERVGNAEYQPIANLPVADSFTVFQPACIHTCR
jgi:hypothetical protein